MSNAIKVLSYLSMFFVSYILLDESPLIKVQEFLWQSASIKRFYK